MTDWDSSSVPLSCDFYDCFSVRDLCSKTGGRFCDFYIYIYLDLCPTNGSELL